MIFIDYSNKQIKITTGPISKLFEPNELPLTVEIRKKVSKELWWSTRLADDMWASYPNNEINDVIVLTNEGKVVYEYEWDVMKNGSIFYRTLYLYCQRLFKSGKKPKGLAIGTHDGEFGEWIPVALDHLSEIIMVEGSIKQYNKLRENFKNFNYEMIYDIITPNGGEIQFFEGGQGYTNSVVEKVIRSWETEEISSSKRSSTSINDLIKNNFETKPDWIHMDVEGLDSALIMGMSDKYLPNLLIFEDNNYNTEQKEEIYSYLKTKNYHLISEKGNCMAIKFS